MPVAPVPPSSPPPRILVLTASVGAGHARAAQAVELALRHLRPDAIIRTVDVLTLAAAPFRLIYGRAYLAFVSKTPNLAGAFYDFTDRALPPDALPVRLRTLVERASLRPLTRLILQGTPGVGRAASGDAPWDLIVHTHFLPAELTARLKRKGRLAAPHATVVTDLDAHGAWVNTPTDRYFTASAEAGVALRSRGVDPQRITLAGIPIHPVFWTPADRAHARAALDLPADRPVVLILAGGAGTGPVERVVDAALAATRPACFVVICGRNAALEARVRAVTTARAGGPHTSVVLGFTDRIHEYYAASDLVLTKPGGLTTSEAMARGCALAIINPIPGQESRNSDHLLELGAAVKVASVHVLAHKLDALLNDPARLDRLRSAALQNARPRAALDVARGLLQMIGVGPEPLSSSRPA